VSVDGTTPDVTTIAEALCTALQTVPGLNAFAHLPDQFPTPVAVIGVDTVKYYGAFAGGDVLHNLTVFLIVGRVDVRSGLEKLNDYMSQAGNTWSVQGAIEADRSLGGVVSTLKVTESGPPRNVPIGTGGAIYLLVPFTVEVHA
jgi:hypothetical protein